MRKTITLLATTTALVAGLGLPAFSASRAGSNEESLFSAIFTLDDALPFFRVSSDDDDDDDSGRTRRSGGDDDDGEDDDDCEDGDSGCNSAANPAPAGTVAPPNNGLFGNGAAPKVQMN
jgi:hypothetical protein